MPKNWRVVTFPTAGDQQAFGTESQKNPKMFTEESQRPYMSDRGLKLFPLIRTCSNIWMKFCLKCQSFLKLSQICPKNISNLSQTCFKLIKNSNLSQTSLKPISNRSQTHKKIKIKKNQTCLKLIKKTPISNVSQNLKPVSNQSQTCLILVSYWSQTLLEPFSVYFL